MEIYTKQLKTLLEADVVVVGSGSAGTVAAIAAARCGVKTVLVERYGFLGGTSTQVLDTFYGFYTPGSVSYKVVGGIPVEVVERIKKYSPVIERPNTFGAGTGITYDPFALRLVWDEMCLEAGVILLMHSFCTDVIKDGNRVTGIVLDGKNGLFTVGGKVFIDATGDADVSYRAGAHFERAGDLEPAQTLTTTFRMNNVDISKAQAFGKKAMWQAMEEAANSGVYKLPRREGSWHITTLDGVVHTIMTRLAGLDATNPVDLTAAEIEGRKQAFEYARFLRDKVPGFEQARISWLSPSIGVRETRRIYGKYRLEREDVLQARKFPDAIAACGAPIEDHHDGKDTKWEYLPDGLTYDIPYRTLVPESVEGLLVVGRCFSASHTAHASCRSMAQTMAMGQAAGVAASFAVKRSLTPGDVPVGELQGKLLDMGAKFGEIRAEIKG